MDKIKLNNQIIDMRKFVKQGKLHITNKLVKEVRLLKVKKGSEAQMTKYQRKADRLLSEINILKKINVDSVSKMCLSSEKDWKSEISDNSISLENRAMARLADFKAVQEEVMKFRTKFPRLVQVLPDLIQQWEEKKEQQKHEEKKLTASEIKKRKKEKRSKLLEKKGGKQLFSKECKNNSPSLNDPRFNSEEKEHFAVKENSDNKNYFNEDAENPQNEIEKSFGFGDEESNNYPDFENEEENLNDSNEEGGGNSNEHVDDVTLISNSEISALKQSMSKPATLKTSALLKSRTVVKLKTPVSALSVQEAKRSGTKEITSLNLEELSECSEIPVGQVCNEENETEEMSTGKRKRDPFFLGNDGESEGDGDEENDNNNSADEDEITPRNRFRQNYPEGKFMLSKNTYSGSFKNKFGASKDFKQFNNKNMTTNHFSKFGKPEQNSNNKFSKFNRPDRNFSNQFAKNGRKPFQLSSNKGSSNFGNKYARDVNKTDGQRFSKFNKDANSKFSSKANAFHADKKQPNLHPSWEAKKKQNMTKGIVAFQGKKIKFED